MSIKFKCGENVAKSFYFYTLYFRVFILIKNIQKMQNKKKILLTQIMLDTDFIIAKYGEVVARKKRGAFASL